MHDSVNKNNRPKTSGTAYSPYRALLRGLYDAVLLVNKNGQIVDCNTRAEKFLKSTEETLSKRTIMDIISGFNIRMLGNIGENLDAGRFTVLHGYCICDDNTNFPAEIAIGRISTEDRDDLVFSIRNITMRKATEEQLRTEHNAIQNSTNCIAITNTSGTITYANPAFSKLTGSAEEEVINRNISDFWERTPSTEQMLLVPKAGRNWTGELIGHNKKGDDMPIRVHAMAAANRNSDGNQIGIVYSFVDITRLRKAEETIREEAKAQIDSARTSDAFSGRLSLLPIVDVIQVINSTEKTGILKIQDKHKKETSRIFFNSGQIISAESGGIRGEEAVAKTIVSGGDSFRFTPEEVSAENPEITKNTMTLLMESAQSIDENS